MPPLAVICEAEGAPTPLAVSGEAQGSGGNGTLIIDGSFGVEVLIYLFSLQCPKFRRRRVKI